MCALLHAAKWKAAAATKKESCKLAANKMTLFYFLFIYFFKHFFAFAYFAACHRSGDNVTNVHFLAADL